MKRSILDQPEKQELAMAEIHTLSDRRVTKLYQAHSVLQEYGTPAGTYHDVRMNWFVASRPAPIAQYRQLIADYERLNEMTRDYSEAMVEELFTEQEADALRRYIHATHHERVEVEAYNIPLQNDGSGFGPYSSLAVGGADGFHHGAGR